MQKPPLLPYLLLALAMIGLGDTAYLSYFQYMNLVPSCAIGGCEVVLTHAWSKFLGIPWSYIGLVYYAYLFCLAVLLIIDPRSYGLRLGALVYTGAGVLFSLWAMGYVQWYIIGALCLYCGMSAVTTIGALIVALLHYRKTTV